MQMPLTRSAGLFGALTVLIAQWSASAYAGAPALRDPKQICQEFCANCHGPNLLGGAGPNLLDAQWNHGGSDTDIQRSIVDGWPQSGMPPMGQVFTSDEITRLIGYLRKQSEAFGRGEIAGPVALPGTVVKTKLHSYRFEIVADKLDTPWGLVFLPDGKVLFTERPGRLRLIENGVLRPKPIMGVPKVLEDQNGGMLDVIAHPDYATNGWIYLSYSDLSKGWGGNSMTAVVRGRVRDGRWEDEQVIFRAPKKFYTQTSQHYGCRLCFDENNHLFFTVGDRFEPGTAQQLDSPNGKIHRVNDDGTIPADNPFVGRTDALPSIWSYGHRNPQGITRSPLTGAMWASEHGPKGGDELNLIKPGQNYGWPVVTFGRNQDGTIISRETSRPDMVSPSAQWTPSIAPCGIEFYTGDRFPEWKKNLFMTALAGQRLLRIVFKNERPIGQEVIFHGHGRVRDVATGPDGCLYVLLNEPGRIVRLVPAD
jgi:aldose sugar dehydrogenase